MRELDKNNIIDKFYRQLEALNVEGGKISKERERLKEKINCFKNNIDNLTLDSIQAGKELKDFFNKHLENIKSEFKKWEEELNKENEREFFREELKNKFIVIIYGKVNAGKSTLGNFVGRDCLEKLNSKFYQYDKDGEKKPLNEGFETKITECTDSIQLFELDGLAWVDTPGLLSLTETNGNLAKDYVEAADYIIFPTSSDAPLQRKEIDQIKELQNKGKVERIRLLITKSDRTEEDEDEKGEIIKATFNKDEETRKKQEEDCKKRLAKEILGLKLDDEIISLSVFTAKKGLETKDGKLFQESNILRFYESMCEVLQKKAQKLKDQAPYASLIRLTEKAKNTGFESMIEDLQRKMSELKQECEIKELQKKIDEIVEDEFSKKYDKINKDNASQTFNEIREKIEDKANILIDEKMKKIFDGLQAFSNHLKVNTKIEDIYRYYKLKVARNILKRIVNKISFDTIFQQEYTTHSKKVGDNTAEVIDENKKSFKEELWRYLVSCFGEIETNVLEPLDKIIYELKEHDNNFKRDLKNLIQEWRNNNAK